MFELMPGCARLTRSGRYEVPGGRLLTGRRSPREHADVIEVREVREDDDLDALNTGNAVWLSGRTVRNAFASAPPDVPRAIFVAEQDGAPAGYAHAVAAGVSDGHRAMANVYVLPAHRRRGVGTALWARVLAMCTPDRVPGVMLGAREGDEVSQHIAVAHGLHLGSRHLQSSLDLTRGDLPVVTAPGLQLREMSDDDAGWERAHALFVRLGADTPDAAAGADGMPYGVFRAFHPEPWQLLLGWDGDIAVGLTAVAVVGSEDRGLNTSLTAVDADYRGRGLATALKATHARMLATAGWRRIRTQNMEGNAPILAANRRLGFAPGGGSIDLIYDHPPA